MTITYRNGVSILELVVYLPSFFFAFWMSLRHGFRRSSGWIYLTLLTVARIVGASCQLNTITNHSTGIYIATSICSSVGLSFLILACLGVLARVNDYSTRPMNQQIFRLIGLVSLVGVILAIIGGIHSSTSAIPSKVDTKTKVGVIIFALTWLALCMLLAVIGTRISTVEAGEKRLVLAVAISVPFIFVRLLYSLLASFSKNKQFSSVSGSVTINLCMAVIEEFVVVMVLLGTSFTLRVLPKSPTAIPGPKNSGNAYNALAYEEGIPMGSSHPQHNVRPEHGFGETLPRRDFRRSHRRGGPIRQLIGLVRDRYQSR